MPPPFFERRRTNELVGDAIEAIDAALAEDAEDKRISRRDRSGENMLVSRPSQLDDQQKEALVAELLRILKK